MTTATADSLIIASTFIRLNGPDGRAVSRANLMNDGTWDVRLPDYSHETMTRAQVDAYMTAQSLAYAITH